MQDYFYALADFVGTRLEADEVFTAGFHGEDSDFVRFNRGRARQAGSIRQRQLDLDLILGRRHAGASLTLSGATEADRTRVSRLLEDLRDQRAALPDDPYLIYETRPSSSERRIAAQLPAPGDALAEITGIAAGRDLVGLYMAGQIHTGFANSLGQRNWHSSSSFQLDCSLYRDADRAVKSRYAGFDWSYAELERRIRTAVDQLDTLHVPARALPPGEYPVFLTPSALHEILAVLCWGGFGVRAHRTKTTPLLRLAEQEERLHPELRIRENTRESVAPDFDACGFRRPDEVLLIEAGRHRDCLVSPRSSVEYEIPTNGASPAESPLALDVDAGTLDRDRALRTLGRGVWISNLWYVNFSDRSACRTTGTTRFATFWVENGEIQAPLAPTRFDETAYRMLGHNLVELTRERELILDPDTYGRRSTESVRLPGALIDAFRFTL